MTESKTNLSHPLRVCHLTYSFYEEDTRVTRYCECLAERGDQVDVIALRRPGMHLKAEADGVRIFRVQRRTINERGPLSYLLKILWFFLKSTILLNFLHVKQRYDLVHVHNIPDFLVFAAWLPKAMGARVILDIHDILPELYAGKFGTQKESRLFRFLLKVERISTAFADHVIVANDLWREKLIQRAVPASKCTALLNYPDLRVFRPLSDDEKRKDDRFLIVYPGTLNRHQGLEIAVRAFDMVKQRMPNAEFLIYGVGPERLELERLIDTLHLEHRVSIKDFRSIKEIARIMADADLGVIPKLADGFGNEAFSTKTVEFMACGVPILLSRTMIDSHYFDSSVAAFFEPGNVESLARALLEDYQSPEKRRARAEAGLSLAARWNWAIKRAEYLALIQADRTQPAENLIPAGTANTKPTREPAGSEGSPQ